MNKPISLNTVTELVKHYYQHDFVPYRGLFSGKVLSVCECGQPRVSIFHPKETSTIVGHKTQRKFNIERPVNQDGAYLILIQYDWDEDDNGVISNTVAKVLTVSGWREFEPYEVMGPDLPFISGMDQTQQHALGIKMDEFEDRIRELISHNQVALSETGNNADNTGKEINQHG